MEDKIGTNKTSATGNDNSHVHSSILIEDILDSASDIIVPQLALNLAH